jgi:hypothetical protein
MIPHKCPVCDGAGTVLRPPWIAGDVPCWVDNSSGPYQCRACIGTGIVWECEYKGPHQIVAYSGTAPMVKYIPMGSAS